jgi:hypothetical protein
VVQHEADIVNSGLREAVAATLFLVAKHRLALEFTALTALESFSARFDDDVPGVRSGCHDEIVRAMYRNGNTGYLKKQGQQVMAV